MNWLMDTILSPRFWLGRQNIHKPLNSPLSVAIVIPAYNEQDHILETLKSCNAQTYPCRIIVVDDASTDNTAARARDADLVIRAEKNQGSKAKAVNLAIPKITEDVMIVVDADTILAPDAVEKLIQAFSDPKVMVACGIVHAKNANTFWEKARFAEYLCTQYIVKKAQGNARAIMVASGCFAAFRTHWLRDVGGFPERTMAEDMDLTWEAMMNGYRTALVMDAHCCVTDPRDWKTYKNQLLRWYRGFLQCIKVRGYWLGWSRLAVLAYGYMLAALIGGLLFMWALVAGLPGSLLVYTSLWMLIPMAVVLWHAYKDGKPFWASLWAFACMLAALPINLGLLLTAVYLEIIKGDTLDTWRKGH